MPPPPVPPGWAALARDVLRHPELVTFRMLLVAALGVCVAAHIAALLCCGAAAGGAFAEGLAAVGVPPCPGTAADGGGGGDSDDDDDERAARASKREERAPLSPETSCKNAFAGEGGAGEGADATTIAAAGQSCGAAVAAAAGRASRSAGSCRKDSADSSHPCLSVSAPDDDESDGDEADLFAAEVALELRCAAPWLVCELALVAAWLGETKPGEAQPGQSHAASFVGNRAVATKPRRYKLADGEPFVMVSYQQAWCIGDWKAMAAALRTLHDAGWRHVWIDVAIVTVDDLHPYEQGDFEKAMRWAVTHAAAIYNPMSGFSGKLRRPSRVCRLLPRCFPPCCCRMSEACEVSHLYLKRPWCLYEAGTALRRRVLWCAAPLAFSAAGATRERRRLVCLAAAALWTWLVACLAFVGMLGWTAANLPGGVYALPLLEASDDHAEAARAFHPYLALTLNALMGVALVALACAEACTQALSRHVVHLRRHVIAGGAGLGTGLMFDLGDAAVLGKLTRRGGSGRGVRVCVEDSSPHAHRHKGGGGRGGGLPPPLSGAVCVLEQMLSWHAQQQQRKRRQVWWPQRWCVIGARVQCGGGKAAVMGQRADGEPCRALGGSASWLDGVGEAINGADGGEDGGIDAAATPGWEVRLGELRAVEGMHWLLCARGGIVAVRHVPVSAETQLVWYVAAYALMQLITRLDALIAVDGNGGRVVLDGQGRHEGAPAWVAPMEDGLWLTVWTALTLHAVWLHGGPLLAWGAARVRGGGCGRRPCRCHAAVLHATMGGRPPWGEAALTLVKGLMPLGSIRLDTPPLQEIYVAVALLNLALGALVLLTLLLSLEGAPRCLSTAEYVLGRSDSDGALARAGRPASTSTVAVAVHKRWPAPPPAAPPRLESKVSASGATEGAFHEFFRRTRASSSDSPPGVAVNLRTTSAVEMASGMTRGQKSSRHLFQNQMAACTAIQAAPTI